MFECVGVPGMIDRVMAEAPFGSRVVVAGVCMGTDAIRPLLGIKELDLRFVFGYTPLDFRDALHLLANGTVPAERLITGEVGLPGVAAAFDALAPPKSRQDPHRSPQRRRPTAAAPGRAERGQLLTPSSSWVQVRAAVLLAARRRLARELSCYRTPAERLELSLILGRHSAEETAEVDAILSRQTTSVLYRRSA